MIPANQVLSAVRLTRVVQALQDVREMPQELKFLRRTAVVPATRNEILLRYYIRTQIADIIALNQKAAVYSFSRFSTETNNIPKLKLGINLTEEQIEDLNQIERITGVNDDNGFLTRFYQRMGQALLDGVRQRMETLIVAASAGQFTYDRFGIKISGVSWGFPADLKVNVATYWDNAAAATPVTDILTVKQTAVQRYGINYNRMTTSLAAFNFMTRTTEFINRARLFYNLNPNIDGTVLPFQNYEYMARLAAPVLGMEEIELYDARYWSQDVQGQETSGRYLPANLVLLSDTNNDNRPDAIDFGNTTVAETQVAGMVPTGMIGELPPGQFGPVAYATLADQQLNPPGMVAWGVAAGWPRRQQMQATAVLNVGTFTDQIPVGVPFPITG